MGDEADKKEKSATDIIAELDSKFQSRLKEHESTIAEKISSLKEKPKGEEESEPKWDAESGDDDEFITKKDIKKFIGGVANEVKKETKKEIVSELNHRGMKANRDSEAFSRFPMLNPESQNYSAEFTAAVKKELDARVARGRSVEDPDLIYDCAASIKATNPRWSKTMDEEVTEQVRRADNAANSFNVRQGNKESTGTPSARQLELAKSFGLSEDSLKNHLKKQA